MKRILALAFALLMLALPACVCAQSPMETALAGGRAYSASAALYINEDLVGAETSQMIEQAALHLYAQGCGNPLASASISSGDAELFTLILEPEDDALYAATGAGVVRLSEESLRVLMDRFTQYMVSREYGTQAEAQRLHEQLDQVLSASAAPADPSAHTGFNDYTPLMNAWSALISDVEYMPAAELDMSSMVCDPVSEMMILHISDEALVSFLSACIEFIKSDPSMLASFESGLAQNGVTMEQFEQTLPRLMYALRSGLYDDIVLDVGYDEVGNVVFSALEIPIHSGGVQYSVYSNYNRITDETGTTHSVFFLLSEGDAALLYAGADLYPIDMGTEIYASLYDGQQEYVALLSNMQFTENETDMTEHYLQLGVDSGEGVTSLWEALYQTEERFLEGGTDAERITRVILQPTGEKALFSLGVIENTCDPAAGSIVTEDAFRPETMTQEEFDAYFEAMVVNGAVPNETIGILPSP